MNYQEIKNFINTYIVQNGVNAITGAMLNTALNELADYYGFDSVVVTTLPAGSDATVNVHDRTLELGIPKGADGENGRDGRDGRDGMDAVNPFKGWFNSLADLKASYTASIGDSAYVKDASPATTWSIYVYDSTASSDNYWADSGIDADTSNVQTFASGQQVNQVHIVAGLNSTSDDDVLAASQGKLFGDTLYGEAITNVEEHNYSEFSNIGARSRSNKSWSPNSDFKTTNAIAIPTTFIKIEAYCYANSSTYFGVTFHSGSPAIQTNCLGGMAQNSDVGSGSNGLVTILPNDIPEGATHIAATGKDGTGSGSLSDCYVKIYTESRETGLVDKVNSIEESVEGEGGIEERLANVEAALGELPTPPSVVQVLGQSTTDVISQKGITDVLEGSTTQQTDTHDSSEFSNIGARSRSNASWSADTNFMTIGSNGTTSSLGIPIPDNFTKIEVVCYAGSTIYYGLTFYDSQSTTQPAFVYGLPSNGVSGNSLVTIYPNDLSAYPTAKYLAATVKKVNGSVPSDCYVKIYTETTTLGIVGELNEQDRRIVESLANNKKADVFDKIRPMKVLFIANSFAVQSTINLPSLLQHNQYEATIGISYLGAATLQQYDNKKDTSETVPYVKWKDGRWVYENPQNTNIVNAQSYSSAETYSIGSYCKYNYDGTERVYRCKVAITTPEAFNIKHWERATMSNTLIDKLNDENWDIVVFIQGSAYAGLYSSYEPYFNDLLEWLPNKVQSLGYRVGWFMPWAWTDAKISTDGGNYDGGTNNAEMFANICSATENNINQHLGDVKLFFPCGTAVENQLNYYDQATIWSDGQHTDLSGYYAAAMVLYGVLIKYFCGIELADIEYDSNIDTMVSSTLFNRAKESAINAITTPYERTIV